MLGAMNKRFIQETGRKVRKVRIGAGLLALLLVFSGEVWMFCRPGMHILRAATQPETSELFPHQDVYLPPW